MMHLYTITMLLKTSLLVILASAVEAAPALHRLTKRHSDCWGSNLQGCSYSTEGYSGAAVSVCLPGRDQELMFRKSEHALLLVSIYWPRAVTQRMVRLGCSRWLISSYDSFIPLCGDDQCLSFWNWRCRSSTVGNG